METISNFCRDIAFEHINNEINDKRIHVYNKKCYTIELGVNWSAIGTVSPEETVEFAVNLIKAAEIIRNHPMNGARIVYGKNEL